jgi:hypothetical protein
VFALGQRSAALDDSIEQLEIRIADADRQTQLEYIAVPAGDLGEIVIDIVKRMSAHVHRGRRVDMANSAHHSSRKHDKTQE